nr:hypothetical protein [Tanacetum cinerariifolium]
VNPLIDHHCCYECGNSLNAFFCYQFTCEFCGNGAHLEEKRIEEEQAAKAQNSKIPVCYDDDDDYNSAITPNELVDSLSMGDEHLNTILDEFIKSCVENLVPNPSESQGKNGFDLPACFITFSNILFDAEYESDSSDYQSCSDEDFSKEIFSNPLFEEEIISTKIDPHHFDAEIDGTDCHPEKEIRFTERLLYDNSSPRPPEEFVSKNSNDEIESFSPYPIPNEDSDSHMKEIDLFLTPDDPMPPSIEDDDDDSERDILILTELPSNYSLSLPVNESFHFDILSFSRPPTKPLDEARFSCLVCFVVIKFIQYYRKFEDSCERILSSKSSFPQLQLGILLLHLVGSQPMLKSSYKAEDGVIISIPPLVGGVADVVVEIKGTGWGILITFRFSMRLQIPDDLSRSRLGFIEKMGIHG